MGDSVPPIPIVETPKYKSKPTYAPRAFKPRKWSVCIPLKFLAVLTHQVDRESREFINGARKDGLVLRHWKHAVPASNGHLIPRADGATPTDIEMPDGETKDAESTVNVRYDDEFPLEKFNVKVGVATYTDEQYESNFKSEEWTKEETDFLVRLCLNFDLRWVLVADRYVPEDIPLPPGYDDSQPPDDQDAMAIDILQNAKKECPYPERSMEALKARYYTIAAKMLETQTPANDMTQAEFQLWEKMRNFDAKTESMRKTLAEKLFERTKDEAEEEKILIEELHRITRNEEEFLLLRRHLYSRLEPPPTMRRNGEEQSTAMYHTSSGLSALLQNLLAREKKFKRPSIMTSGGADGGLASTSATPGLDADGQPKKQKWEKGQHPNQYTRRDTMDTQNGDVGPPKKGSQSHGAHVRTLTPADELKYGVSHPQERLISGVQFRHEKVHKLVAGKSLVQTQKMQAALVELGIPTRLVMPTDRVCKEFETLVTEIQILLDARKVGEKVQSEIKVLEEHKRIRLGLPKEVVERGGNAEEKMDVDDAADHEAEKEEAEADVSMMTNGDAKSEDEEDDQRDESNDDDDADDAEAAVEEGSDEEDEDNEDSKAPNEESAVQMEEDEEDVDEDADEEDEEVNARRASPESESENDEEEEASLSELENEGVDEEDDADDHEDDAGEASEDEEEEEEEEEGEEGEEEEVVVEEEEEGSDGAQGEAGGEEEEAGEVEDDSDTPSGKTRPTSAHSAISRLHKRSASVVSEASKAGSNRSGLGRKKRR